MCLVFCLSCKYQSNSKVFQVETKEFTQSETTLSVEEFNDVFQEFLDRYVVVLKQDTYDTRVDYKKIAKDIADKNDEYLGLRAQIESYFGSSAYDSLSDDGKVAFLINAYNFFVINLIADKYPIKSILDIPGGAFDQEIFNFKGGKAESLNQLEKEILKDVLVKKGKGKTDARLHFALICGAMGCPILSDQVYQEEILEKQLETITQQAFELPRIIEVKTKNYVLVELFSPGWYRKDFLNHSSPGLDKVEDIYDFIAHYLPSGLQINRSYNISIPDDYNWDLNEVK